MDAKARLLLKQLESLLKEVTAKKAKPDLEVERISEYLQVLLTGCEAKLFSKACVKELLEGVHRVVVELGELSARELSANLHTAISKAANVARVYPSSGMEKFFSDVLIKLSSTSAAEGTFGSGAEWDLVSGLASPRGLAWHRPYLKALLPLLEYHQVSEKKIAFKALLGKVLPIFLAVLKDTRIVLDTKTQRSLISLIQAIATFHQLTAILSEVSAQESGLPLLPPSNGSLAPMARLPVLLLELFQEETLTKDGMQTLLLVTQGFADECLKFHENNDAYGLLDKAILLADQENLATAKVNLALRQGKIFSGGSGAKSQQEKLPGEKALLLLNNYFDALPIAETSGNSESCAKLYQAITVLEKQFLYQTMKPWVAASISQAVESGVKETYERCWGRFQALSQALLACELPQLAWDCLYRCQSALTVGVKALHEAVFEELVEASAHLADPMRVISMAPVTGEWQRERQQLLSYRKLLARGLKDPSQFLDGQRAYTENMQGLVAHFFQEAQAYLGTPPEPYAVLGLGSISRKTMSPYSDFECVFLVSDSQSADWDGHPNVSSDSQSADWDGHPNASAEYFDALYRFFEFKMGSLGEIRGFRLDVEGHPRKEGRLRGTPANVIQGCNPAKGALLDDAMTYSLVQPCLVYGDEGLWKAYQTQFTHALGQPVRKNDATPWGTLLVNSFVKFHTKKTVPIEAKKMPVVPERSGSLAVTPAVANKATSTTIKKMSTLDTTAIAKEDELEVGINVKKQYVSNLFYLLTDIALHHQYFFTDPSTALEKLVAFQQWSPTFAAAYRQAILHADRIRVRLHFYYQEQQDAALAPMGEGNRIPRDSKLTSLTTEEYATLQCIDWAVLQPMQQALLRWQAGNEATLLQNPVHALLKLTVLDSQQASDNRAVFSTVQREAMRSLVAMLWLAQASPEEYRREYLRLPNAAIRSLFSETLTQFKGHYEISAWQALQRCLEEAPYRDGSRDAERAARAVFESQLACLIAADNRGSVPVLEWIQADGSRKSGSLHPEVVKALEAGKLLDSKGKFQLLEKHVNLPGRHLVFPLDIRIGSQGVAMHVKFFPEMPGMEYAAGMLARLLVGWGAPYVQLARLVDGSKVYPVLLSQTVVGDLLSDVLKQSDANQFHEKLDRRRYSQRLLLSLLLNQEDAKPSNFIAVAQAASPGETQYALFCIDNDRSFFQAVVEENGQIVPIVKDMTYCFETMHEPLAPIVCVDALFLDPFQLLQNWLDALETFNRQVKALFSDRDVEKLFPKNPNTQRLQQLRQNLGVKEAVKDSILPIVLREQVAADLFVKMVRIQQYLKKYPQATGYQLLRHVEPYLSKYYGNLLQYYPQIDARFQLGFARLYSEKKDKRGTQQTLKTAFATLQTFHGKPVDSQAFLERRGVSIQDAQLELACAFDRQHTWESVYDALQKGLFDGITHFAKLPDHYLRSKIVNQLNFLKWTPEFEQTFWETVLPLKIPFQKLVLKHSRITSAQFEVLLQAMPELRLLHLEDCQALEESFIGSVAQYCPILEKLWLSQLPFSVIDNRQSFIRQLFTPVGAKAAGVFEELRYLSIRDCTSLSDVSLNAPSLTHVEIQGCRKFVRGALNSEGLREIKLGDAPSLTQASLSKLVQQASRLKVFEVQGCPLLKALPFYQRFPYLLPLDVTVFSSGWVTRFIEVLAPFEPRKLADAQVEALVSALKTYTVHLERFKNGLLEALKEASMDVNVSALLTLGQLGYFDASVNAALQGRLKHENGRFVQAASIALLCLQGQEVAPEVLERVESALSSPDKNLSQAATRALMGVSGWTEKLATPLSQQLSSVSSDAKKTQGILASLGEITVSIPAVIPAIEAVLSEKEPATQASALWVLGRMGVLDARFSQNLPYFQALGRNGVQFSAVLSHLARLDRDISRQFQGLMLPLCKSLPVPSVPAELVKQVKDPRWDQRKQAMVALRDLQGDSPEIRGIFVESARDISHHVRQLAVEGLAALPHPDAATSMAFTYALQDKERLVCEAGMQGFGNHPSLFQLETLQLMQALISTDSATSTRKIFAQTLSQLSQRFPKAFEQLLGLMQTDKYTEVKQAVMESLLTWLSFNGLAVYLEEVSAVTLEANAPRSGFFNANKPVARAPSQRPEVTPPARLTTQTTTLTSSRIPVVADDRANVPSVLFPNNFRYLEVLKRFRKTLWDTITTPHTVLETAALTRLLGEATTPLLKAVLLEAFEWLPFKLAGEQDVLKDVRLKLTLAKRVVSLSKKGKFDESAQSVLTDVQSFLQRQLADVTDGGLRQALQEASDRVRILRTIFAPSQAAAFQKDESAAFKQLTARHLLEATGQAPFDATLTMIQGLKKVKVKPVFEPLRVFLTDYLPIADLQANEQALALRWDQLRQRHKALVAAFRNQLQLASPARWKPQWLYGTSSIPERSGGKKGVTIQSFFHINQGLLPDRWVNFEGLSGAASVLGSTYFGAEKPQLQETTLCMDANYQQGHTGATSDGYGHFADAALNRSIQQAAYRTVKLATRYADLYARPEDLFADLPRLFQHVGQAVKQSGLHPEESGTASCVLTKVFPHSSNATLCTVVAAGVGDGMVMAWDPKSQQLQVLVKPRQYDRGKQFTPVSITESLKGEMLQSTMVALPAGAFVMRLTDGGWQALAHIISAPLVDPVTQKRYLEYTLDTAALMPELTLFTTQYPQANAKAYREFLLQRIQKSVNQQKAFLLQETHTIRGKIDRFGQKNSPKVGDFFQWVEQTDPNYIKTLLRFFEVLHVDMETVKEAPLSDFLRQLDKIHLGDDVAIHVEQVGEATGVSPRLGMRV